MNNNDDFGRFPFFFAIDSFSINLFVQIFLVWISISTKSIFAPQYNAQLADATNEFGEVQTISFFFSSIAIQAK